MRVTVMDYIDALIWVLFTGGGFRGVTGDTDRIYCFQAICEEYGITCDGSNDLAAIAFRIYHGLTLMDDSRRSPAIKCPRWWERLQRELMEYTNDEIRQLLDDYKAKLENEGELSFISDDDNDDDMMMM